MKTILNKILFGSSLFVSVLAFAETADNKDVEAVPVVCTGEDCPTETVDTQKAPVEVLETTVENK